MVTPMDVFGGLAQGYNTAQHMQMGPQLNQLKLLQEQAKLNQMQGLDPVSQQNIAASQQRMDIAQQQQEQESLEIVTRLVGIGEQIEDPDEKNAYYETLEKMKIPILSELTDEDRSGLSKSYIEKKQAFQQGTGDLAGFVFNPNTGEYKANPLAISSLQNAAKGKKPLNMSDIRDINNDVTKLTDDARAARSGAQALIDIGDNPTPAQAVAAIFKFMKSLDPTSVVRQEEQGLVASASGPMAAFAAQINRLTGSGPLTTEVMRDIITTASGIANSTIEESATQIDGFLSVYPELSKDRAKSMRGRVPELLTVPEFTKPSNQRKETTPSTSRRNRRATQTINGVTVKRID